MCNTFLPSYFFSKNKYAANGLESRCKSCSQKKYRLLYASGLYNQDHIRNPRQPKIVDGHIICRICDTRKPLSEYYTSSKESNTYQFICKSCSKKKSADWRTRKKQSRTKPDAEVLAAKRYKRHAGVDAIPSNMITGWREAMFTYYGWRCLKCGCEEFLQADHVIPISKGGTHRIENMQPLCRTCNLSKHNRSNDDYRYGDIFTEEKMLHWVKKTRKRMP